MKVPPFLPYLISLILSSRAVTGSLRGVGHAPLSANLNCNGNYATQETCDADPACSWCECAAIPSACYNVEDVGRLPPDVFACSKRPNEEAQATAVKEIDPDKIKSLKCFLYQGTKDTCLQDDSLHCSWCTMEQDGMETQGCFPGFVAKNLIENQILTDCDPVPEIDKDDVAVEFPNPHGMFCGFNMDKDTCETDEKCTWCQVVLPKLKDQLPEACASKESAQQMIDISVFSSCDGIPGQDSVVQVENEEQETQVYELAPKTPSFQSVKTEHSFSFDPEISFVLSDETVDPNFCDPKSPKSLAGYVSLDGSIYDKEGEDKHYFYWFFESRAPADENTPFFIWLTGGPGCSSSLALLSENGPCSVNEDGDGTVPNPFSWNENAHALWLDQPTGVGYSYGSVDDHNEDMVGENAYYFLQSFLQSHPEYAKNPLFITGESYAGHYVPAITHRIWRGNKEQKEGTIHLNLQGMAIGNGLTSPEIQYPEYAEMAFKNSHNIQVIDEDEYNRMKDAAGSCTALINKCNSINRDNPGPMEIFYCQSAVAVCNTVFMVPYELTGLNPYDIREKCEKPPLCYDFSHVDTFLNSESTKKALHISKESHKWESCNFGVHSHFMNDWMKDMSPKVADVLNDGIHVLIYAGDVDFICNYLGNRAWTKGLDWAHKDDFNAAEDKDWNDRAGLAKSSNGFTFLQVFDAGHMVPMNKPEVALTMINQFFAGVEF